MDKPLLTGHWNEDCTWELYRSDVLPDVSLCTAVYCLAILPKTRQVVLTRNQRGWEMLGGHIEPGETVEQAMIRECLEEGGFTPQRYRLFGYREITARTPLPHAQRSGASYPFPYSYIPHFVAVSNLPLQPLSGNEIIESRCFTFDQLASINAEQWPIRRLLLDFYHQHELDMRLPHSF